jgi:hypothetical protein
MSPKLASLVSLDILLSLHNLLIDDNVSYDFSINDKNAWNNIFNTTITKSDIQETVTKINIKNTFGEDAWNMLKDLQFEAVRFVMRRADFKAIILTYLTERIQREYESVQEAIDSINNIINKRKAGEFQV